MTKVIVKYSKDGRIITLSYVILTALLWILMGFNTSSADISYYKSLFIRAKEGISYHAVETGFWLLVKGSVKIGFSYELFLIIYTMIGLLLISSSVIKYSNKPGLVLLAYLCYPFLLDVAQIRHFMATAIFIYAIRYLQKFNFKNLIKYCVLILIASSQQIIALAYLFFLIVYVTNQAYATKLAIFGTAVAFIVYRFLPNSILMSIVKELRNSEINYFSGISIRQFILYFLFYLFLILLCYFLKRQTYYISNEEKCNNEFLYKICMYSAVYIPFILLDYQYTRLFRGCIIILYIFISDRISYLKKYNRIILFSGFSIIMILVGLKLFGPQSGYYQILTIPIFKDNGLLRIFF